MQHPIEYMSGNDNIWADMLSRLWSTKTVEEPSQMAAVSAMAPEEEVPFLYYQLQVDFGEAE